jgi:hypothetical protein
MLDGLAFLKPTKLKLSLWLVMLAAICADELIDDKLGEIWFLAKIPTLDAAWKHFNQVADGLFSDDNVFVLACVVTITLFIILFIIAYISACLAELLASKYYSNK